MTILEINKYHYLKGGADTVFFNTMELLEAHGHKVVPFAIKHPKNLPSPYQSYFVDAPEIRDMNSIMDKVKSIPRFISNKNAARQLEELLKAVSPDVAHIHNMFNGLSMSILPVLHKHNIPVVVTMHETRFVCPSSYFMLRGKWCRFCRKSLHLNCLLRRCYQDSLTISAMSTIEMIHKDFLFNYDKYINRYVFLSKRFLDTHAQYREHFRKKGTILPNFMKNISDNIRVAQHKNYFLYYGRLTQEKGIKTLISAIKLLPNINFKIAGTGPLQHEIEAISGGNVEYLGFVVGDKLTSLVENAKFTIVPSECEDNNPMTIIESYGLGTPVLGARMGGIPEIIDDNNTGLVFEPFNVQSLRDAIIWGDKIRADEYKLLSLQAHRFAQENFNPETYYDRLMIIFNEAIDKK
ncbi:MAG: glycosyltransferase [Muribaculaceae bacterium]|nr:glycosyltransferase [Muribaculaceae bacterium]